MFTRTYKPGYLNLSCFLMTFRVGQRKWTVPLDVCRTESRYLWFIGTSLRLLDTWTFNDSFFFYSTSTRSTISKTDIGQFFICLHRYLISTRDRILSRTVELGPWHRHQETINKEGFCLYWNVNFFRGKSKILLLKIFLENKK